MKNAWKLFKGDMKRLRGNVATVIVVLGIVFLPSIFSWYNIIACWNVFENTGNLSVAVANVDEGYKSDLVPIKVSVGDQVVSALRANDQINWVFTDEDDAIDGAKSGKYYAAVVIPESFSRDMMTFYSDDVQHAQIVYYSNEKKNAIAPKVTDQGADQVSVQVNQVFMETLSDAALGIAQQLLTYADDVDANSAIADLGNHVASLSDEMTRASSLLRSYSSLMGASSDLVSSSGNLLADAKAGAQDVVSRASGMEDSAKSISSAMDSAATGLTDAIATSSSTLADVRKTISDAFDAAAVSATDSKNTMNSVAAYLGADTSSGQAGRYMQIADDLDAVKAGLTQEEVAAIEVVQLKLRMTAQLMSDMSGILSDAASDDNMSAADVVAKRDEVLAKIDEAKAALDGASTEYDKVKPSLDQLSAAVSDLSLRISNSAALLDEANGDLVGAAGSVAGGLTDAKQKLDASADDFDRSASKLSDLSSGINEALATGDTELLRTVLGGDTSSLASALAAPVELDRHALYPVENFGSAMAPLYTSIALWIGALLIMVTFSLTPSERILRELDNPKLPEIFLGRFGVVALLSIAQSLSLSLGNMFFLHVQVNDPALYLLCFVVSGLVFAFIIYTLVASFANLGKALAVILLILQVAGANASFPIVILPDFFQQVSAWLPATYAVKAMRAAMFGVYGSDFWVAMGSLLLYTVPFIILGFILRNPTMKLVDWFVEKVEESKVI